MSASARHCGVALTVVSLAWGIALAESTKGDTRTIQLNDSGLSTRELIHSATELADGLRSSDLVLNSPDSIQVAAPAFTQPLGTPMPSAQILGQLLNEINMRTGAKIQFIRRDSNDPEVLPASTRFDYESRILVTGRGPGSVGKFREGLLLMELYEPAGESPVFAKRVRLGKREEGNENSRDDENMVVPVIAQNDSDPDRSAGDQGRNVAASAIASTASAEESARRRSGDKSLIRKVPFGRVEFKEKKTARRLAVLSESTKQLSDGRLYVELALVSREKSQEVEIEATFVDDRGRKLGDRAKRDFEFDEGRPGKVVFRSRRPAAGFVMRIEDD